MVVASTEWHARIDPLTTLRFQNGSGDLSEPILAMDLRVDRDGAWVDRTLPLGEFATAMRITGLDPDAERQLEILRPSTGTVAPHDNAVIVSAPSADLLTWLLDFQHSVAPVPAMPALADDGCNRVSSSPGPAGAFKNPACAGTAEERQQATYQAAYQVFSRRLGSWELRASTGAWEPARRSWDIVTMLEQGVPQRAGWRWRDVQAVTAKNVSGGKTAAAVVVASAAVAAIALVLAPVAVLAGVPLRAGGGGGGGGGGGSIPIGGGGGSGSGETQLEPWQPAPATFENRDAAPLFTLGRRVRAVIQPTVTLDSSVSYGRDLISTGALARIRFGETFEIGGGVRSLETSAAGSSGWQRSTAGVFAAGLHLPLADTIRLAMPLGFEIGAGGQVNLDLRVPWGLRYTSKSSRWFATLSPATPSYLRVRDEPSRWSLTAGTEVGLMF